MREGFLSGEVGNSVSAEEFRIAPTMAAPGGIGGQAQAQAHFSLSGDFPLGRSVGLVVGAKGRRASIFRLVGSVSPSEDMAAPLGIYGPISFARLGDISAQPEGAPSAAAPNPAHHAAIRDVGPGGRFQIYQRVHAVARYATGPDRAYP